MVSGRASHREVHPQRLHRLDSQIRTLHLHRSKTLKDLKWLLCFFIFDFLFCFRISFLLRQPTEKKTTKWGTRSVKRLWRESFELTSKQTLITSFCNIYNLIHKQLREGNKFRVYVVLPLLPAFDKVDSIQALHFYNTRSIFMGEYSVYHALRQEGKIHRYFSSKNLI